MKILIIMDPLHRLNQEWDNSLHIAREMGRRGHQTWAADVPDLSGMNSGVIVHAQSLVFDKKTGRFLLKERKRLPLEAFNLVLIRKEPPVNSEYLYMTCLLEPAADKIPMINHPRGIRNVNEKLWTLNFPEWVPPTLVTGSVDEILAFEKKHGPLVIKPVDDKGGKGVFLLSKSSLPRLKKDIRKKGFLMAQKRIMRRAATREKRIVLLNGKLLTVYEKRPQKKEFRANLDLGATFHACGLSPVEKKLVRELKPHLLREGLLFVGLDVLDGKLLEVNVTCPAGVTEGKFLNPKQPLLETWADFLESSASD